MTKKLCVCCEIEKNRSDFTIDSTRADGRHRLCKVCKRTADSRYSPKYLESRRLRDATRSAAVLALVNEYKSNGCELCPEKVLVCLDLHHRDPTQKEFGINAHRNGAIDRLVKEMKKCAVLCSNCHRKVHAVLKSLGD